MNPQDIVGRFVKLGEDEVNVVRFVRYCNEVGHGEELGCLPREEGVPCGEALYSVIFPDGSVSIGWLGGYIHRRLLVANA